MFITFFPIYISSSYYSKTERLFLKTSLFQVRNCHKQTWSSSRESCLNKMQFSKETRSKSKRILFDTNRNEYVPVTHISKTGFEKDWFWENPKQRKKNFFSVFFPLFILFSSLLRRCSIKETLYKQKKRKKMASKKDTFSFKIKAPKI